MASEHVGMAAQILQQAELALDEPEHVASSESCSHPLSYMKLPHRKLRLWCIVAVATTHSQTVASWPVT